MAADDAIRAQSVRSVAGAGVAVLLLAMGSACSALFSSDVPLLRWTMWVPGISSWFLAMWACTQHAHQPWLVRRRGPPVAT